MTNQEKNIKQKVIFFSVFVILSEIINEVEALFHPVNNWITRLLHLAFSMIIMFLLFLLIRDIQNTTKELKTSDEKLRNIFDTLDVAIWFHDLKANSILITPGIEKLYARSLHEFYEDHELWRKVISPDDMHLLEVREKRLQLGEPVTSIYRIIRPDGEVRWIQDRGFPKTDENGNLIEFSSVLFDITDRQESEDRYRSLVEMSPDIILVTSKNKIDYINETGCKLIGATNTCELVGQPLTTFITAEALTNFQTLINTSSEEEITKTRFEVQVVRLDGKSFEIEMAMMPILYEGRSAWHVVGRDITERKKVEKTIEKLAYYDTLTGLPNRNLFRRHLKSVLSNSNGNTLAVLFLDLDRFKMINDTKGHTIGDLLLKEATIFLRNAVQNEGMVSRQGGDEFIILLENTNKLETERIAKRILKEFSNPIKLDNNEFFVTPSIGISMYPEDGVDQETLIKHADSAMYLAKEWGKKKYQFYSAHLDGLASRTMELENGLRKALAHNELLLFYQPNVELKSGRINGVEALIRWNHPKLGMIPPTEFIPLAEETGLIIPLGNWVLEKAMCQYMNWMSNGIRKVQLAVNVSVRQLQDEDFIYKVQQLIEKTGMDAAFLELEITESIMQDIEKSILILNRLKQLGVQIAIDDFGKGYSSLSYLMKLPIDKIKIDKLFVEDISNQADQSSIMKSIIDMVHSLKFNVIAEGIEKKEQALFLQENGCELGQGYYFCKPLPPDEIVGILEKGFIFDGNEQKFQSRE